MTEIIIHTLDQELVQNSVTRKIKVYQSLKDNRIKAEKRIHQEYQRAVEFGKAKSWSKPRTDLAKDLSEIETCYNNMINQEKNYHSSVRVIECKNTKMFYLAYGDENQNCPEKCEKSFGTLGQAQEFFFKNKR